MKNNIETLTKTLKKSNFTDAAACKHFEATADKDVKRISITSRSGITVNVTVAGGKNAQAFAVTVNNGKGSVQLIYKTADQAFNAIAMLLAACSL